MKDNIYQCPLCGGIYDTKKEVEGCFHYDKDELKIHKCSYTPWDKEPEAIYVEVGGKCIMYERKKGEL